MPQGKQTVNDEEIIEAMRKSSDPAFTASELAQEFDMTVEGMRRRLENLAREGKMSRKKPSSRTVIWWVKEDQRDPVFST